VHVLNFFKKHLLHLLPMNTAMVKSAGASGSQIIIKISFIYENTVISIEMLK